MKTVLVVLVLGLAVETDWRDSRDTPDIQKGGDKKTLREMRAQLRNIEERRLELVQRRITLLKEHLQVMKRKGGAKKAVEAMEAILELQIAALRARKALQGANIHAADGQFLGRLAPSYDSESLFCPYGKYGTSYSSTSIWCPYGKYGASYEELSPFCSYSAKPPRIELDRVQIGSLTVGGLGQPIAISPNMLKALFAE